MPDVFHLRIPRNRTRIEGYLHGFNDARRLLAEGADLDAHAQAVRAVARKAPPRVRPLRQHRLHANYPRLWRAVEGAAKVARFAHPDIIISDRRLPSLVKRIVGQLLALGAGSGRPDETGSVQLNTRPTSGQLGTGRPPASCKTAGGATSADRTQSC
jgi:hypothetical protein